MKKKNNLEEKGVPIQFFRLCMHRYIINSYGRRIQSVNCLQVNDMVYFRSVVV